MQFESFSFGSIQIDGVTYEHDVVIESGKIRKRKKKPSQKFRDTFGDTPLSIEEEIPWECDRLVIGTGTGALPVMDEVKREARRRKIALVIVPTARAIALLEQQSADRNRTMPGRKWSAGVVRSWVPSWWGAFVGAKPVSKSRAGWRW